MKHLSMFTIDTMMKMMTIIKISIKTMQKPKRETIIFQLDSVNRPCHKETLGWSVTATWSLTLDTWTEYKLSLLQPLAIPLDPLQIFHFPSTKVMGNPSSSSCLVLWWVRNDVKRVEEHSGVEQWLKKYRESRRSSPIVVRSKIS